MEPISVEQRYSYFTSFQREALHLEMRDVYATNIEREKLERHLAGEPFDPEEQEAWWRPWIDLMGANTKAGKVVRRLRVISEPVTDYIRFEWMDSDQLLVAGEDVRWLPRRHTSALLLPGNDFWLFDDESIIFTDFSGDGEVLGHTLSTDPQLIEQCRSAFETAWPLGIPHNQYKPA